MLRLLANLQEPALVDLSKITSEDARAIKDQLDRIERQLGRIEALQRFQIEAQPVALPPVSRDDKVRGCLQ